jgi:hypothetical protein
LNEWKAPTKTYGVDVGLGQRRARRVARVDDDDGAHVDALGAGVHDGGLEGGDVGAPGLRLVEVVGHALGVDHGERGRVERVLRDRDEHAGRGARADDVQQRVDAGGGAGGEVDVRRVGGEAVAACTRNV